MMKCTALSSYTTGLKHYNIYVYLNYTVGSKFHFNTTQPSNRQDDDKTLWPFRFIMCAPFTFDKFPEVTESYLYIPIYVSSWPLGLWRGSNFHADRSFKTLIFIKARFSILSVSIYYDFTYYESRHLRRKTYLILDSPREIVFHKITRLSCDATSHCRR